MKGNGIFVGLGAMTVILLGGLFYVLSVAFANPVEMANDYQMPYKQVDKNYDKIVQAGKLFDAKYRVAIDSGDKFDMKSNRVSIKAGDLNGKPTSELNVTAWLTRPDTSKLDVKLDQFKYENGHYVSPIFDLPKEGRWQVNFKISQGDAYKFVSYEGFAKASN